jgi:3-dehydroquinate dehydratase/shikimate dehydrogenase
MCAEAYSDIVELRLDCLIDTSPARLLEVCDPVLRRVGKSLIITLRPASEGGRQALERNARMNFWRTSIAALMSSKEVLVDIELDLISELTTDRDFSSAVDWQRVICSFHEFAGGPADLNGIYDQIAATPARTMKIAAQVSDTTDCIPFFQLLGRASDEGRDLIAIGMGEAGLATRVLGPSRGAFMTYGSVDVEHTTAPGQVSIESLVNSYRVRRISSLTQIYGLIGNPVSHSISPQIHNAGFSYNEIDAVYLPLEVHDAREFFRRMVQSSSREITWNLRGLSVTAPHKNNVVEFLDWIEPAAREIGAVNTIVIENGSLRGYNTDADAFLVPLQRILPSLGNVSCAVVGAGGAARTAAWALQRAGARVTVFARDAKTAKPLVEEFGIGYQPLEEASFGSYDVVVNATPLGTAGANQNETVASAAQLRGVRLVYDLVYNPIETRFIHEARRAGCQVIGGLEMFLAQAAAQFELWTGQAAPLDVMHEAAVKALPIGVVLNG